MGVPLNYNIRNLVERKGTTLMTAVGIALTVAVLVVAMALTEGLKSVFAGSGDPRQMIVMRTGVEAELTSSLSSEAYQIIRQLPGIAKTPHGDPMVSPEGLTVVNLPSVDSPEGMNVTVRGMLPIGTEMRTVKVVSGRMFTPGMREVVVGESIARRYPGAQLNKELRFGKGMWTVVGVFGVGESAANSEIWTDLNQMRGDFEQQGGSSSLLIRADVPVETAVAQMKVAEKEAAKANAARDKAIKAGKPKESLPPVEEGLPPAMAELKRVIDNDQRLNAAATGEKHYYEKMTESGLPLQILGFFVAIVMAVGSAFAATNTMYAAVARRAREIGTLRAIGFGRWTILRSFLFESVCLALIGGVIGVLIALPINGLTTGVGSFATFSETAFKFRVSPLAIIGGLAFASLIGAVGGFLPAWSASKKGIVAAMRDLERLRSSVDTELQKLRIDKSDRAQREERAKWPWLVAAFVVLLAGGAFWQWRSGAFAAAPVVQTVRVRVPEVGTPGAESVLLQATGYVMAAHKIELASKVVGRVAWIGVEMGDRVEQGQVLARLEDDEYKARVAQQRGQLDNARARLAELEAGSRVEEIGTAKAQLEKAQAEVDNAIVNFKRLSESPKGSVSRQQVDDAESLVRSRKAQVESQRQQYELTKAGPRKEQIDGQRATVRQLEGSLAMSEIDLSNTVIRAPIKATVLNRNVEQGEFVTTGFVGEGGAKGHIVSLADLNDLRVELDISQNDFSKVASQQPCRIVTDAYPDKKYKGVVDLISPEANRQKATVQVRVKVLDPDELLKPDMNATVSFLATQRAATTSTAAAPPAIRVPVTAVRGGAVFVVENGKAVRRAVEVSNGGATASGNVEVRAGLIGGEDLIVSPPESLEDGAAVRVQDHSS